MIIFNHEVSIVGFLRGCWPILAIDSSHMSEPYGSALFSTTSYDASDYMFPVAYGVMSSENYENWNWFLHNLRSSLGIRIWSFYQIGT